MTARIEAYLQTTSVKIDLVSKEMERGMRYCAQLSRTSHVRSEPGFYFVFAIAILE